MWSRPSTNVLVAVSLLAVLAACSVTPRRDTGPGHAANAAAQPATGRPGTTVRTAKAGQGVPSAPAAAPIPAEAKVEFDKALALDRAGNDAAAEAQLTSLAQQYAQLCAPLVDLGILYRKSGNLDAAAHALQQALARDPKSALAWTELGITRRLGGHFHEADTSYAHAIAADPAYAPAYRDRGVLRDLYLDQPAAALADFEQYHKLTGEKKPVEFWIAELRHRTGVSAPPGGEHATASAGSVAPPAATSHSAAPPAPPQARN